MVTFGTYSQSFKEKWLCPECVCSIPKRGNSNTPVRTITPEPKLSSIETPTNRVNIERGNRVCFSPTIMGTDSILLEELREFRSEVMARMDSQANAITILLEQFSQTKSEFENIIKVMRVLEEKVEAKLTPDRHTQDNMNAKYDEQPISFVEIASQPSHRSRSQKTPTLKQNQHSHTASNMQKLNNDGAIKSARLYTQSGDNLTVDTSNKTDQEGWTTVRNKKVNRRSEQVKIGTNAELKAIQSVERKKHLHIWRLHPETTVETITNHVKSICGPGIPMQIEKIKHRTERDYSSFIVGVPEKWYEKINLAEVWPKNAEFNEWIWFRKSKKPSN